MHRPEQFLLTGSAGFVGSVLARAIGPHQTLSLGGVNWREAIASADYRRKAIIHLAARVHEPGATDAAFEADNVEKTRVLAQAAADGGATRLVFASTVKVFGEESGASAFRESDPPRPEDAYARSKWRAEELLREMNETGRLPVVVVRIPLTYGAGAGGNFRALVRLADSALWLPLAGIANRRSIVHVDDLASALVIAATHPGATGRVLLPAYPVPVSTPGLVESIRRVLGRQRRLFPVPPALLEVLALLAGQRARMRRLTRSLEVDSGALMTEFGWKPRMRLDEGLRASLVAGGTPS